MAGLRVLVSGAGIAGSVAAYWLAKGGAQVTVIERASAMRTAGQCIEVKGAALDVAQRMGLEDAIRAKVPVMHGLAAVDGNNKTFAAFKAGNNPEDLGFISELEIMRGDLVNILYNAANEFDNVEFRFDTSIRSLTQKDNSVSIEYTTGEPEEYDIVIAADGLRSRTRDMILDLEDRNACIRPVDAFLAGFSIKAEDQDSPNARFYIPGGSRTIAIRPLNQEVSSVGLIISKDRPSIRKSLRQGVDAQKAAVAEIYEGAGWETVRVIAQMKGSDNFYLQEASQVRLDGWKWYQGRCALVGDAAYCPSPFTGEGVLLAVLGAYILAGEIIKSPHNPTAAFEGYEDKFRAFAERAQSIPLGGRLHKLASPETAIGVWLLRFVLWFVAWSGIFKLIGGFHPEKFEVPSYALK